MRDLDDPSSKGTLMQPTFFLSGQELPYGTSDARRRQTIAQWMTSNEWFAKAYVNRMWSELVGEGFCEPVDDLGPDHPPHAPQAFDLLSTRFARSGYDPKWLFRTIAATQAYGRESRRRRTSDEAPFTANCAQRLRGDQLFNALTSALEIDEQSLGGRRRRTGPYRGARNMRSAFNVAFGYDPSVRRDEISASIPQALTLMNAPQIHRSIDGRRSNTMIGRLLREIFDDQALAVELYLRCLARQPEDAEIQTCLEYVQEVGDRREAFEDVLWALINSTEFTHRK